jgi:hypothetical protein
MLAAVRLVVTVRLAAASPNRPQPVCSRYHTYIAAISGVGMDDGIDIERLKTDQDYCHAMRYRMQTDLFFLAKHCLGYDKITERWHREAVDVFIQKDPTRPLREQHKKHRRILLLPRRTYKTTLSISDAVQWILCFPDVAIMVMCAANSPDSPLADAFVAELADHFFCPEGCTPKPLHICFPEHVIRKMPKAGEFLTPARTRYRRDPTVKGVSIEQSLSGWHPDILKGEDVQDNRNSQTPQALKKVKKNFYLNLKMLGEGGYVDLTATRYGPADLYADMIAKLSDDTVLLWKSAYVRKPHALKVDDDELTEQDVILQFPEQLSWRFLREEKALDPDSFWTQYMNVAEGNFIPTFPIERLQAAKVDASLTEFEDNVYIAWRFEYDQSKHAACAVGVEHRGRMTIVEVIRGVFTPTALARRVVSVAKRWETHQVEIEATPGSQNYAPHIRNEALEADWWIDIRWSEFLQDDTARVLAIKSAEPHLLAGRLLFSAEIQNLQEVFRQLYCFGMVEEMEVASVVSRVAAKLPPSIAAEGYANHEEEAFQAMMARDAYNRVFAPVAPREEVNEIEPIDYEPEAENEYMPGLSG